MGKVFVIDASQVQRLLQLPDRLQGRARATTTGAPGALPQPDIRPLLDAASKQKRRARPGAEGEGGVLRRAPLPCTATNAPCMAGGARGGLPAARTGWSIVDPAEGDRAGATSWRRAPTARSSGTRNWTCPRSARGAPTWSTRAKLPHCVDVCAHGRPALRRRGGPRRGDRGRRRRSFPGARRRTGPGCYYLNLPQALPGRRRGGTRRPNEVVAGARVTAREPCPTGEVLANRRPTSSATSGSTRWAPPAGACTRRPRATSRACWRPRPWTRTATWARSSCTGPDRRTPSCRRLAA